jgi:hypothetical protein
MIAKMGNNNGLTSNLLIANILKESLVFNRMNITEINIGENSPPSLKLKTSIWMYLNPVVRIIKAKKNP